MTTDGVGAIAQVTDALGHSTTFQYDSNENVTQVTDPDGHVATSTYDANGNLLTHVDDPGSGHLNLQTSYTYDSSNNVLTKTNPLGVVTQYTYDSPVTGNLIKTAGNYVSGGPTNSDTNVTTTATYDSSGEVLTSTDALGVVTKVSYDSQGDVISTTANYTTGGTTLYERPITLTNNANASALSNYQVSFQVDTASLISAGKMRSDCGDIRFTDFDDATALPNFWVENCNSSASIVWVKMPSIPASGTKTIYLHYGNSSQTSLSSVSNTFIRDIPNTLADWPMHESSGTTVADTTGNGYTGTATSATTIVSGQFGNARSFPTTAAYVQVANESTLPFGKSARTVCAWASTTSLTGLSVIFDTGTTGTDEYFGIGRKNADLAGFGWNDDFYVPNFFTVNTWNQVCLTYDGTTATLYGNGVQLAQATKTAWNTLDAGGTYIGNDRLNHVWYGGIDEISYYSRALSAAEISDLAHNYGYATSNDKGHLLVRSYSAPEPVATTGTERTLPSSPSATTSATYDVLGERLTATNPLGIVTQYTYDNLGQLIKTVANYQSGVQPDQQTNVTTQYGYDALGRQINVTSPLSIVTHAVYDADGRITQTILNYVANGPNDTQTNVVSLTQTYDAMGNVLTAKDALSNVTTTTYDLDNQALQVTQKSSTGTVLKNDKSVYDAAGLVVESDTLDANNNLLQKVTYTFDGAGRGATVTIPPAISGGVGQAGISSVMTTIYDAAGSVIETKVTNAALPSPGIVTDATTQYDHLGRVLSKTEQANTSSAQKTSFTYDLDGRQTSVTNPASQTTSTTYDALGNVLTVTHPDTTVDTKTYDAAGDLLSTSNSAGTTKDTYDPLGRVTYEERDDGTGALQMGMTSNYNADGDKLQQQTIYPGGTSTTYTWTYDKLDRTATMSDGTRTYAYDLNSNVTQMMVAVGSNPIDGNSYSYDGANRLTGLTVTVTPSNTTLHTYGYAYDLLGNRNQVTEDGTTTTYNYDNLNQLTKVAQGSTTVASYSYDANGNRTSMVTSAGTTSYTYNSSDTQLTSKTDPSGKITNYTYDTNGNLTKATYDPSGSNQVTGYVYDQQNRLIEVDEPDGMKIQFAYDADGNRISKTVASGSTTTTVKDVYALGHLNEQTDGSGNVLASFTYETNGRPASVVLGNPSTGSRYYYVYNGHGDVMALTDASGNVVASYTYDAFGAITSSSENFPGGWSNPYRYDGAEGVRYDGETNLYWMSVRAYDPTLGRFISHDPLGRLSAGGGDLQPYVYTNNNPLNRTDPSGRRWIDDSGDTGWINGSGKIVVHMAPRTPRPNPHPRHPQQPHRYAGGGRGMSPLISLDDCKDKGHGVTVQKGCATPFCTVERELK